MGRLQRFHDELPLGLFYGGTDTEADFIGTSLTAAVHRQSGAKVWRQMLSRPDRFLGMHFMNPVPVMVLVEVIRALQTSDATFTTTLALCEKIEKKPVAVNDSPGFVSNRVLMPLINEAAYCVMEGVADAQAVDAVMKMGMNHPIGPLELADLIGIDVCLDVMEVLHTGFADSEYRPCPLLRKMASAAWVGRKYGRGFCTYASSAYTS